MIKFCFVVVRLFVLGKEGGGEGRVETQLMTCMHSSLRSQFFNFFPS